MFEGIPNTPYTADGGGLVVMETNIQKRYNSFIRVNKWCFTPNLRFFNLYRGGQVWDGGKQWCLKKTAYLQKANKPFYTGICPDLIRVRA